MNRPISVDGLAGAYALRPGHSPAVVGERPVLGAERLAALLRGLQGDAVSPVLESVFTLCAHAHRRAGALAMAAARGTPGAREDGATLLLETARDHLRSIALDWPQRVPHEGAGPGLGWLRGCPLKLAGAPVRDGQEARRTLAGLRDWIEREVLLAPPADWLARHGDPGALPAWCDQHAERLPPAGFLAAWHPLTAHLEPQSRCLQVLDDHAPSQEANLRALARCVADDPQFAQRPTWRGSPAENGPWARLRHLRAGAALTRSVWTRLTSRWLELVEIAACGEPGAGRLLSSGASKLAPGESIAWCEMARGLLLHWVRVDEAGAVRDYRVLAPTEWNFHPGGTLALAVGRLDAGDSDTARALAAAFDPCVACGIVTGA